MDISLELKGLPCLNKVYLPTYLPTSVINTQHNSNLELCSLQKNRATQKQVVNLELTKSLFATGDEMLTSYSRCHAKNVQIAGRNATGLPLKMK